jgi:hypothetical protein
LVWQIDFGLYIYRTKQSQMKHKYFVLSFLLACANLAMAIIPRVDHVDIRPGKKLQTNRPRQFSTPQNMMLLDTSFRWFNYGETMSSYQQMVNGNLGSAVNYNYLFPDSTILTYYGMDPQTNTPVYDVPFIHNIGTVLDISSPKFYDPFIYYTDSIMNYSASTQYRVDSVAFIFSYVQANPNVTDSLIFELATNLNTTQLPTLQFSDNATSTYWMDNYGSSTVQFKELKYAQANNVFGAIGTNKRRYAVALNGSVLTDTLANGLNIVTFSTANLPVMNAGSKFVISNVKFKPGYTGYNQNWLSGNPDTLTNMNYMLFGSYEEVADTFNTYYPGDFNSSQIVPTAVRYNYAGGFNGRYIPSYAYGPGFGFEHHLFYYRISKNTVITGEKPEPLVQAEVFPNPGNNRFTVNFSGLSSKNTRLSLRDLQGRLVEQRNILTAGGAAREEYNVENLANGTYLLSIEQEGKPAQTTRVIVQH